MKHLLPIFFIAQLCSAISPTAKGLSGIPEFTDAFLTKLKSSDKEACKEFGVLLQDDKVRANKELQSVLGKSNIPFECLYTAYDGKITDKNIFFMDAIAEHLSKTKIDIFAMDFEFSGINTEFSAFLSMEDRLQELKKWIQKNSVIEFGLALIYSDGQAPKKISMYVKPKECTVASEFVKKHPDLMAIWNKSSEEGVDQKIFTSALRDLLQNIRFISKPLVLYGATWDIPFMMDAVKSDSFKSMTDFKAAVRQQVPQFIDVKLLADQLPTKGISNISLEKLAESLGVSNVLSGVCHEAGYDALITGLGYQEWIKRQAHRKEVYLNIRKKFEGCSFNTGSIFRYYCTSKESKDVNVQTFSMANLFPLGTDLKSARQEISRILPKYSSYKLELFTKTSTHQNFLICLYADKDVETLAKKYGKYLYQYDVNTKSVSEVSYTKMMKQPMLDSDGETTISEGLGPKAKEYSVDVKPIPQAKESNGKNGQAPSNSPQESKKKSGTGKISNPKLPSRKAPKKTVKTKSDGKTIPDDATALFTSVSGIWLLLIFCAIAM